PLGTRPREHRHHRDGRDETGEQLARERERLDERRRACSTHEDAGCETRYPPARARGDRDRTEDQRRTGDGRGDPKTDRGRETDARSPPKREDQPLGTIDPDVAIEAVAAGPRSEERRVGKEWRLGVEGDA